MTSSEPQEPNDDFLELQLIEKLTAVIMKTENVSAAFSALNQAPSRTWCRMFNRFGDTLLQSSIVHNNKEAFDFLLRFYDVVNLETPNGKNQTALAIAIKYCRRDVEDREYYALELINNGAFIHTVCDNDEGTYLHLAVMSSLKVVRLLLEKGIDVNFQDGKGNTALHRVLMCNDEQFNVDELVAILMYYNVDPFVENNEGYIPFEYAVKYDHKVSLQESLFLYTFDEYTNCRINIETVIQLAKSKSPFFHEIFKHDVECFFLDSDNCIPDFDTFNSLLGMDCDYLEILTRKCTSALNKIISLTRFPDLYSIQIFYKYMRKFELLTSKKGITNLNVLLESETKPSIVSLLKNLKSRDIFRTAVQHNTEEGATQILMYLLSYGLHFVDLDYHTIYESFGYCDLLKLLLRLGHRGPFVRPTNSIMPLLLYDFEKNIEDIFKLPELYPRGVYCVPEQLLMLCKPIHTYGNTVELMDHFAHPKLTDFLMQRRDKEKFSEETLARIRQHPKVPLLVEMARNVYRQHLIKEGGISSTSEFYTVVDQLPISHVHKKIITYETKLYY